jgi:hypothetical protein
VVCQIFILCIFIYFFVSVNRKNWLTKHKNKKKERKLNHLMFTTLEQFFLCDIQKEEKVITIFCLVNRVSQRTA